MTCWDLWNLSVQLISIGFFKEEVQSVFTEDHSGLIFHSKEVHTEHCKALNENPKLRSIYGVKKSSVLNSLQYQYHCTDNYDDNIMHDLLEGVVQYELKLFFEYLVKQDYVSLNTLSDRIQSFNYGYTDRKNKPSGVKMDNKSKHLGLNDIQSWCLLHNTPLIFGYVIERNKNHWNFLLLLIQIVNVVFSYTITDGMICYLKHLICDHHTLFKELFPDKRLIPKHHLMIHYPRYIKKIGPLIHMWCMRFEAKHHIFKRCGKNFKNLIKPLVKQHQHQLAFNYENYCFRRFEFGPTTSKTICDLQGGEELRQTLYF
ncbi:uncharacterized protein LOC108264015 isoform X1 [Ictalurus punctatus]|uniref:Uncharacterized protein LOC108264015 isoform X1 n=1 Tax=Ictalurus punctatus TaxID=7998 RepID=A0A2D0QSV2_ICTPU|nr:uncharacterized protein LOC108264015 isoform X1 [Ictalurus punctatus]XP_017320803.1 uncharacterized protein LOC108264015 isoform X1 [Ictalurus punctatus]XP_017320806.1 uncharacterized protein LOC108264015 isoform X1 [Ictalurus punctatus]XP_053534025.1 uncharacterized protein LOC108264015 isoform X1 [Ictalurus punctatus]XP_053534026.1 uncharacterized protein LOC108264015 isoform X1 [Ictalurus punctatus]